MALTKCRECGMTVSSSAKSCPQCGVRRPARKSWTSYLALIAFALFVIGAWGNLHSPSDTVPLESTSRSQQSTEDGGESIKTQADARTSTPNNWSESVSKSEIDDSTNVVLTTLGDRPIPGALNQPVVPVLQIVCQENRTSVYVNWKTFINTQPVPVMYRIDDGDARSMTMQTSSERTATGLWTGGSAIPFIKKITDADDLLMRVTPYGQREATVKFDVRGLSNASQGLRKACHW